MPRFRSMSLRRELRRHGHSFKVDLICFGLVYSGGRPAGLSSTSPSFRYTVDRVM